MFTTEAPSFDHRPIITPEEYRSLKRQLFNARRQYATVLHALREGVATATQKKKARRLETRISGLELRLAFSTVTVPDETPLRLRDIVHRWLAVWWVGGKEFATVKFRHAERQHIHL